jgi:hypothetical protein
MARSSSVVRAGCIALPVMFASGIAAAGDIVETAQEAGSFQTLLTAAEAAGLVDTLKSEGPFTVFAPTDEALAKLPEGTVEDLLSPRTRTSPTKRGSAVRGHGGGRASLPMALAGHSSSLQLPQA